MSVFFRQKVSWVKDSKLLKRRVWICRNLMALTEISNCNSWRTCKGKLGNGEHQAYNHKVQVNSKTWLLNLLLLNLIVKCPTERSHYINNLWNATFGLWKIRIMNGWMVSFEWKISKHHENRELVATLWLYYEIFHR